MSDEQVIRRFHEIFYGRQTAWRPNEWLGISTLQNPFDVWITQEIIVQTKPDFIVEAGAYHGGSAALWATILKQVNPEGRVISIDIEDKMSEARKLSIVQERVEYIVGSSTAVDIVDLVKEKIGGKKVMVILDSDHRKAHVMSELKIYSEMVPVGGYLIVQDSNINGHPVRPGWGEGPMEAIVEFLQTTDEFEADRNRERMLMSFSPNGFLKRVK
jgi:cephalosporin hydroxylase